MPVEIAKLMLITKVHALAEAIPVQPKTLERIIWHIENDVIPVVPERGSVGASGRPGSAGTSVFLPLLGLGEYTWKGERIKRRKHYSKPVCNRCS